MTNDPRTRSYRDGHLVNGWSKKAVYRALKRAVARGVFAALTGHCEVPQYGHLRPTRRANNISLTHRRDSPERVAARVGELELGRRRDDDYC